MKRQMDRSPQPQHRETLKSREVVVEQKSLVLLMGLPGSGKSTFAHEHFPEDSIISTDNIRREISNNPSNHVISNKAFILARRLVQERLKNGEVAVIDAQNLSELNRKAFVEEAEKEGASIQVITLNIDADTAVERDKGRTRPVGEKYIRERARHFDHGLRMLQKHSPDFQIDVLNTDEIDTANIRLPETAREQLQADREFAEQAKQSEYLIGVAETGFLKREHEPGERTHDLPAGSILFTEDTEQSRELLKRSFLPHQIIDVAKLADRLATDVGDEAVSDVTKYILRQRLHLNLTTTVLHPQDFPHQEKLDATIAEEATKREITIPSSHLDIDNIAGIDRIKTTREAQDDTPLLLIGDVHGAYTAMRELAGRVRRENLEAKSEEDNDHERTIVFVGDMADRGPYDAETVIYITALVRSGRAVLVKGNHDANLLSVLKGEYVKSKSTNRTAAELKKRLKPKSLQKIMDMLEEAPLYAEWEGLVAVHGSLPRIPRPDETVDKQLAGDMVFGKAAKRTRLQRIGHPLAHTVAHDPEQLIVGGHTHEGPPSIHGPSGSVNLDADAERRGELWGMYYPELTMTSVEEPEIIRLNEMLKTGELPQGKDLLLFVEYAAQQRMVKTKVGEGKYEGLTIVSYTPATELGNLWKDYPTLRHFRGIIMDQEGSIVARPFQKTHKAGIEIPLEDLEIKPDQVFEKANGSLIVMYHHNGSWNTSTKFSFDNETWTQAADRMLANTDQEGLDPKKTYLFEIILPNDPHIVDYEGEESMILLNAIENETGKLDSWDHIQEKAAQLGVRTAEDMTESYPDMTIADIYRFAQEPGATKNLEGLMAIYPGADGEPTTVKVKAREYDDKKFIRDRLEWKKIFERIDIESLGMSEEQQDDLLLYQYDNPFVTSALETRLEWIQAEAQRLKQEVTAALLGPMEGGQKAYDAAFETTQDHKKAVGAAMKVAAREVMQALKGKKGFDKGSMNSFMGFLRKTLSGEEDPDKTLNTYVLNMLKQRIDAEIQKKGKNSYWLLPE
jgi:predicted kinase